MRKIEEQMNMAIRSRKNWSGSNTTVQCFKENGVTTEVNVLLHGNCIAWFDTASNDFNISSAGWETVTTKSRLNAILEEFAPERRVFQKNWQWFVSDFLGMAEPFVDGMKIQSTKIQSRLKHVLTISTRHTCYNTTRYTHPHEQT